MKTTGLMVAALAAAMSLASCSEKTQGKAEEEINDSTTPPASSDA